MTTPFSAIASPSRYGDVTHEEQIDSAAGYLRSKSHLDTSSLTPFGARCQFTSWGDVRLPWSSRHRVSYVPYCRSLNPPACDGTRRNTADTLGAGVRRLARGWKRTSTI